MMKNRVCAGKRGTPEGIPPLLLRLLLVAVMLLVCPAARAGEAGDGLPVYKESEFDVGVEAVAVRVKSLGPKTIIDAVENDPVNRANPQAVVSFRILRVFRGELGKMTVGGPSKYEQMKAAAQEREILKLVTLDFENPDEEVEQEWLKIAVRNPMETFGIKEWDNPGDNEIKLYLKRLPERPDSYILIKAKY